MSQQQKEKELEEKVKKHKEDLCISAENVIQQILPKKILDLSNLLKKYETRLEIAPFSINSNSNDITINLSPISSKKSNTKVKSPQTRGKKKVLKSPTKSTSRKRNLKTSNSDSDNNSNNANSSSRIKQNISDSSENSEDNDSDNDTDSDIAAVLKSKFTVSNNNINISQSNVGVTDEMDTLINIIKSELREFVQNFSHIDTFITLKSPEFETGNNFGVEIQQMVKQMAGAGQTSAQMFLNEIPEYYHQRGKFLLKSSKFPNVMDYKRCIEEIDSKQMLTLINGIRDLRNSYWIIYDILQKNWQKIIKPKGDRSLTFSMY